MKTFAEHRAFISTCPDETLLMNTITGHLAPLGRVLLPFNLGYSTDALNAALDRMATLLAEGVLAIA